MPARPAGLATTLPVLVFACLGLGCPGGDDGAETAPAGTATTTSGETTFGSDPVACGELECDEGDDQPLSYALSAIDLNLAVDEVELLASDGRLDLTLYINLSSTPAEFEFSGDCTFLTDLDDVCETIVTQVPRPSEYCKA